MALYFICYDITKNSQNSRLINELVRMGGIRMLDSNWCMSRVNSGDTQNLFDHLKKFIENDSRLLISEVTDWAGKNIPDNPNKLK